MKRRKIAIDIDDVVAKTSEAVQVWANETSGATLTLQDYFISDAEYWSYYETAWRRNGLTGLEFAHFLETMNISQEHVAVMDDARRVIDDLKQTHDIVFITARRPEHKESTRRWLDERIGADIPLYLSHNPIANSEVQSKGELCVDLQVDVLIDDSIDNCASALACGVDAILFGDYGWNMEMPSGAVRCASWREIEGCLRDYK